ncbi:hypothetical protein HJ588_05825 [Flexivirga sp. ID2601S]|uniref:Peptidase M48 domain-containing protein n=1 Tax=Flexivirga aerilata TaxID=1656889 RepID=A0A849APT9_9MICO|nr:hypothetical protein [Flexivirga aerilata]NNG38792.1 hypothetical protein [Flexivirga aerilata]
MKNTRAMTVTALTALTVSLSGAIAPAASAAGDDGPVTKSSDAFAGSRAAKSVDTKATFDRIVQKLPADWQARRDAARTKLNIDESPVERALRSKLAKAAAAGKGTPNVIDPTQYQCGPTKLDAYVDSILAGTDAGNLQLLSMLGALDAPTYDAILFGTAKGAGYQLLPAYKTSLTSTFGTAQRFWDVRLNDVQLMAMHGQMVVDENRLAATVQYMYGVGAADAKDIARDMISMVRSDPALKNGKNPIFTLNAFAFSGKGDPDPVIRKQKDKMVFGDGILAALKAIGLNQVGPKAVLGHEMAHHVQYEDALFDNTDLTGPEATRRTELMADSFGTYFVTHKKGLAMTPKQILQTEESFYDVGDCAFDNDGHHGTPNQRRAAAAWGAAVVAYSDYPNRVLPSMSLATKFDKVLPELVKPDAPTSIEAYRSAAK